MKITQNTFPKLTRRGWLKTGLFAFLGSQTVKGYPEASSSNAGQGLSAQNLKPSFKPAVAEAANLDRLFETIKREASDEELYRFLYQMPKGGDIHHHLGGGILPHMWYAVAADAKRNGGQRFYTRYQITDYRPHPLISREGVSHMFMWINLHSSDYEQLPSSLKADFKPLDALNVAERAEWMQSIVLDANEGLNEFFEYHWSRLSALSRSIHVVSELLVENMQLFGAEGVRYLEIQRGAFAYVDTNGQALPAEVADAFWSDRLSQPDAVSTGVTVRWQGIVLRFAPKAEDSVRSYYEHIDAHREQWVGINMAGREDNNKGYPQRFKAVYDEMLRQYPGIGISIHAGESSKPDAHIRDTLRLGATRIGHGINLIRDEDTLLRMRDSQFLVEINLISNELLGYVPDLDQHPFPVYLRQGVACCLNTDDRGMWDSNFTDEVYVAVKRFNLSWSELCQLADYSYQFSFAEPALKQQLITEYKTELKAFQEQFNQQNWRQVIATVPAVTHGYGQRVLGLQL